MCIFTDDLESNKKALKQQQLKRVGKDKYRVIRDFVDQTIYVKFQEDGFRGYFHINNGTTPTECIGKNNGCKMCNFTGVKSGSHYSKYRVIANVIVFDPLRKTLYYVLLQIDRECATAIGEFISSSSSPLLKTIFKINTSFDIEKKEYKYRIDSISTKDLLSIFELDNIEELKEIAKENSRPSLFLASGLPARAIDVYSPSKSNTQK